jgi:membrane-associated phospholipid phosphatase
MGAMCAVVLVAVFTVAVWTAAGQRFEDAVLTEASQLDGTRAQAQAAWLLVTVRKSTLAVVTLAVLLTGWLRRRLVAGLAASALILMTAVATQVLQLVVYRPVLLEAGRRREDQSFPSGHTAIAMATLAALIFVLPPRWRIPATVLSAPWAIGIGLAAVTAGWHRPSDVLGSYLIVLVFSCGILVFLAGRDRLRLVVSAPERPAVRYAQSVAAVVALAAAVLVAGGIPSSPQMLGFTLVRAVVVAAGAATTILLLLTIGRVEPVAAELRPVAPSLSRKK